MDVDSNDPSNCSHTVVSNFENDKSESDNELNFTNAKKKVAKPKKFQNSPSVKDISRNKHNRVRSLNISSANQGMLVV